MIPFFSTYLLIVWELSWVLLCVFLLGSRAGAIKCRNGWKKTEVKEYKILGKDKFEKIYMDYSNLKYKWVEKKREIGLIICHEVKFSQMNYSYLVNTIPPPFEDHNHNCNLLFQPAWVLTG